MIARIWSGTVPADKGEAYLALMRDVALPDYAAIPGNLGAWCLHRTEGDCTRVSMLTFWSDMAAIERFAGEDAGRAKYYDFDADFLIEMPPGVDHFEMFGAASASASAPRGGERGA